MAHPNWRALPSLRATGVALKGELLIDLGDAQAGTALLEEALESMRADRQSILVVRAAYAWARGLAATGQADKALAVINETLAGLDSHGEVLELPELLRVKASILLTIPDQPFSATEDCLRESMRVAQQQGAKSWELRSALTLARARNAKGDPGDAQHLLAPLYEGFTEGFDTRDLRASGELMGFPSEP